ncbi:MAG: LysR family transcriptional regulator, partial [Xanthomonadaceae bacterium]|nr:LysR family transcriptional regulator [Xanthomonadaceae bacterium]
GQVMVIAPPGWWPEAELAQPLSISALAGQPMIGITVRDALGSMLQSHLAQVSPAPRTAVSVQTYQLAQSLVAKGEGLALVDPFTARCGGTHSVQMRPVRPQLDVVLYAMHRSDSPLNPVQKRFLDLVKQLAQRMPVQG